MAAPMMDEISNRMIKIWNKYKSVVSEHPDTTSQVEATVRLFSYAIAGCFQDGQVLAELVYSSSKLIGLLNDTILQQATRIVPKVPLSQARLMKLITVMEYVEVFVELAAQKVWGEAAKWLIIFCVQLIKAVFRYMLLWCHSSGIQTMPPIMPLDRDVVVKSKKPMEKNTDAPTEMLSPKSETPCHTFTLKRSQKPIRTLTATPAPYLRTWKLPVKKPSGDTRDGGRPQVEYPGSTLTRHQMWAENMYIGRPLIHLLCLLRAGQKSWKPWLCSLAIDISSLCLMGDPNDLNPNEKMELKRRTITLLYYLLRSPFFDKTSKVKIILILNVIAQQIPVLGLVIRPLVEYLPSWQRVYFYLWST